MASKKGQGDNRLRDQIQEKRLFTRRAVLAGAGVLGLMGLLGGRMAHLQISGHQHYATMSQANRVRLVPVPPNRGLIHDRNGVILAENRPTYQLMVIPEQVPDLEETLAGLGAIIELEESDLTRFHNQRQRQRRFDAIPLKFRLDERDVAIFATNRHRFPGVEVEARLSRVYPQGEHAVHAIGHVGRINEQELQRIDSSRYRGSTHIGKSGAELQFEDLLHGHSGIERVEANALGRVIRPLERLDPNPGTDVYLTIDSRLQRIAEEVLGDWQGSIVALDTRNGDILALVSKPTFDPNLFVHGIDRETFQALQADPSRPLYNRAMRGQYPPGSTIKPFVALASLENEIKRASERVFCPGFYTLPGVSHRWRCWQRRGHGHMNMEDSLVQSCDVYFYDVAYRLGIDRMQEYLGGFGFGRRTGSGVPGELPGVLPSREWKRAARGESWYHGETLITGIGQGFFLTTPMQLAHATAVLANKGSAHPPQLIKRIERNDNGEVSDLPPEEKETHFKLRDESNWQQVVDGMIASIRGPRGTARSIAPGLEYEVAGKTGTAQVFSLGQDEKYDADAIPVHLRDHALFNCFAPADDPRISVAVVVENGGSGGGVAAPMARQVMDAWHAIERGQPIPRPDPPEEDDAETADG